MNFSVCSLQLLLLVGLFACQETMNPPVRRPQPFALDSVCVLTAAKPDSRGDYRTRCCDYLLSDSVSQTFFRRMQDKNWEGFRVLNLHPDSTRKQYLDYSVIDGRSHYDRLLVEFYYFWPSNLTVGRAEFRDPDTFTLRFAGEVEPLRIPPDSATRNFNFIRYFLQVPEAHAEAKQYKILFDCGGLSGCTIYQKSKPGPAAHRE